MKNLHIVIPARYNSSRFPGKLLKMLGERSIIQRVYQQAEKVAAKSINIVTDDERILQHALTFTNNVTMSKAHHESGTDRIAEFVVNNNIADDDIVVNVQGDEPMIPPDLIIQVYETIAKGETYELNAPMVATLAAPLHDEAMWHNNNVVKVVCDINQNALYFSRNMIPSVRSDLLMQMVPQKHVGLYAYTAKFLRSWHKLEPCILEKQESLEQLRILWYGYKIKVATAVCPAPQDINTPEDLENAKNICFHNKTQ